MTGLKCITSDGHKTGFQRDL